jgi:hypothetical protein
MATEPPLDPDTVARRLAWLTEHWVPDDAESARARMEDPRGLRDRGSFDERAAARLEELRALCDLTTTLHRAQPTSSVARDGGGRAGGGKKSREP